jgi:hypothetical protein
VAVERLLAAVRRGVWLLGMAWSLVVGVAAAGFVAVSNE